ncbi:MAG: TrkH family potassium uptake protein [Candidatus Brocadia sp. AMX2]|uniref:Potassium uptake protein TrkH family n=1 Tax=Candidatus Brocadia sinica JPN1 TaxID=1197129 RepID=A0ABQ0JX53_9BACT|nr:MULTISPECIES: TrkH family potassium uptake protein [Brocadia]KXK30291.1 MAG: potassium transporter protein [Candidatus Brocadia sinica]MBC6933200.1 TrkH family potassium uptake protein [Candidatus Brocadia sp.]MBL1169609.1 TrkH family potassium uptake protein [Candidatus Brocadia sp. AMX1]NOG40870.1 TrkH family potassium uptake protein [Planctomycetota bacterium]KAA0243247.1 MAG: TrkH family potassium uptake protein [Candidatus Brocadia sp. AMX2]
MKISIVLYTVGNLVLMLAGILLVPLGVAFYYKEDAAMWAFVYTIIVTGIFGGLSKAFFRKKEDIGIREGIAIVTLSWIICILLSALPFWYSGACTTYCDAVFETTSGFTTTGASIFKEVEILPQSILFWRAFTCWVGGMGIIVVFVALLPAMGVSGYQLFSAEVSGPTADRLKPRIGETAKLLWYIYLAITASMILTLFCGGMPIFDAVCHTFSTVSTAGFSTKNTSIAYYNSLYIEIAVAAFMFICGCNFALYYKCFQKEFKKVFKNSELRFFAGLILMAIVFIATTLYFSQPESYNGGIKDNRYYDLGNSFRYAFFQVITVCTGTGHVSTDFDLWPNAPRFLLVLLMFIGACAGSTGGGIKCVRILLMLKSSAREFGRILRPRMVKHVKLNGESVSEEIITESSVFFVVYLGFFGISTLALMALNTDIITAFSAVATCMANCGPGLAKVGPMANYSEIAYAGKWILSFCMLLGRLEIYSLILIFLPILWKR